MEARFQTLRAWQRALLRLENNLCLYGELSCLLQASARGETCREVAGFLEGCAEGMRRNRMLTLEEAAEGQRAPSLTEQDRAALRPLWQGLGRASAEECRLLLGQTRRSVAACAEEAANAFEKNKRLAGSMAAIGSAAVFLFLL